MQLTIRPSSGPTISTSISSDSTVLQLKTQLATTEFPISAIRLVYSGRVLKDEDALSVYDIKEGQTIHMVRSAANRASEQANSQTVATSSGATNGHGGSSNSPFGSSAGSSGGEADMMATLLQNPMMQNLMSNPDVVRRMMMSNPNTRQVMENNPEIAQMINDPAFLRQSIEMARNPNLMKQAMRNNDRALSNLEMLPGGFNHLRRMYHTVQEPMENSRNIAMPTSDEGNLRLAAQLNADTRPSAGELNTTALPNPWAPRPQATQNPMAMFGGGSGASAGAMTNPFAGFGGTSPAGAATGPASSPFGLFGQPPTNNTGRQGNPFMPGGNNPEAMQQYMQFAQMMQSMRQQQSNQSPATPSQLPGSNSTAQSPFLNPAMFGAGNPWAAFGMPPFANPNTTAAGGTTTAIPSTAEAPTTPAVALPPPEQRFESQLASMREMGFSDTSMNVRALLASGGDINSAIAWLLR